ncbi:hypothetical protein T10_9337 [Trichinella papuae]|uniref:Uncharacterized protein n=1 Tax=Trichinella papuae TaxID=268474 RepID=A0A0V1N8U1_9BILA|nr:hypothetical protein T10_9337 [Trichinella papuae]
MHYTELEDNEIEKWSGTKKSIIANKKRYVGEERRTICVNCLALRVLENVSCFFPTFVKFNADYSATVCSVGLPSVPG